MVLVPDLQTKFDLEMSVEENKPLDHGPGMIIYLMTSLEDHKTPVNGRAP